jgi:two-component system sensor histidine kinase DevS
MAMNLDFLREDAPEVQLKGDNSHADVKSLHKATLSLYSDLSLDGVLRRIVIAARELSHARYAALGIPDEKGGLEIFITDGLSEEEIERIPHPPIGRGLIGEMMREAKAIRIPEIEDHPRAVGFPQGHPKMHSFLGVPISAYGHPVGQIYLSDKEDASEFSERDQWLIEMLAAHAGAAITNARLYRQVLRSEAELSQRNDELELINDLTSAVSAATGLEELLGLMLERVLTLSSAGSGEIFLLEPGNHAFCFAVHRGKEQDPIWQIKQFFPGQGFLGKIAEDGKVHWTNELEKEDGLRADVISLGYGKLVGVPLSSRGKVVGVLGLAFIGDREIDNREAGLLAAVGAGVGIGIENARLQRQARRVAILEERERIAMDLHDGIIQSIYAIGLTLDSVRVLIGQKPEEALSHLENAIDGLNANIRDIRSYILDLQPSRLKGADLEEGLARLGREFENNTHVEIDIRVESDAVMVLDTAVSENLLHIAQEALANVAKHAQASKAWVCLRSMDSQVYLQIIDNGCGFEVARQPEILGHGLSNMAERAQLMGGEFEAESGKGEGTAITVRLRKNSME